ncbi:phage virion morphogenesis protein [Castellaniella caeni]|uniref:phage virion morphogenesis protein n=1 Tax=Castellaniella caeni TaxID=266123 RepID=UPI000C9F4841|nr:phage virion morphogenesis protein [Castellaniella caeni]
MIKIQVNVTALQDAMDRLIAGLQDTTPLMQEVVFVMQGAVAENFEQGGRPKWQAKKDGKPSRLQDTGKLTSSITPAFDRTSAVVGTNVAYAAIHQFGGKTAPHVIRPKTKKALKFGGKIRRSVNHPGSNMPARPFLALTQDDRDEIELTAQSYLRRLID